MNHLDPKSLDLLIEEIDEQNAIRQIKRLLKLNTTNNDSRVISVRPTNFQAVVIDEHTGGLHPLYRSTYTRKYFVK